MSPLWPTNINNCPPPSETLATPQQAQTLLDEIDRILVNAKVLPGSTVLGEPVEHHSAPSKVRWHENYLFIRNPEGQSHVDGSSAINLGSISHGNGYDELSISYKIELTTDGLNVTKHTHMPSVNEEQISRGDSSMRMLETARSSLVNAAREREDRITGRQMGLDTATEEEVAKLINTITKFSPAPASWF